MKTPIDPKAVAAAAIASGALILPPEHRPTIAQIMRRKRYDVVMAKRKAAKGT